MGLDLYNELAKNDTGSRLNACEKLIEQLQSASSSDAWDYALNRLIKGLASPREAARLGFSMALTELLTVNPGITTPEKLFDLLTTFTAISGGMNGQEQRDQLFGRLFGLNSIVSSKMFMDLDPDQFRQFLDILFDLWQKKNWLRSATAHLFIEMINRHDIANDSSKTSMILEMGASYKFWKTNDGVAVLLVLMKSNNSLKCPEWNDKSPLHPSNLQTLGKVLRVGSDDQTNQAGQSAWSRDLPIAFKLIADIYVDQSQTVAASKIEPPRKKSKTSRGSKPSASEESTSVAKFEDFWRIVIDESLFATTSSPERKYWGFQCFDLFFRSLASEETPILFSKNFMRTFINQLSDSGRLLNSTAGQTVTEIVQVCAEDPDKALQTLRSLISQPNGSPNFDNISKTKLTETLIMQAAKTHIDGVLSLIFEVFLSPQDEEARVVDGRRQWSIGNMFTICKQNYRTMAEEDIELILSFLALFGHFTVEDKPTDIDASVPEKVQKFLYSLEAPAPEVSSAIQTLCRSRLESLLSLLLPLLASNEVTWPYKVVRLVTEIFPAVSQFRELTTFDSKISRLVERAIKVLNLIRKRRSSPRGDQAQLKAFELLFSLVLLQIYNAEANSVGVLEELLTVYVSAFERPNQAKDSENEDEDDPGTILAQILLQFLVKKSSLLRKLSESVWYTFAPTVKDGTIEQFIDILSTKENLEGQNALFNVENEDSEDNSEVGSNESDDEGDEDDDDEEEEEEEEDEDDRILKEKLANALRIPEANIHSSEIVSGSESEAEGQSSDDEEDLMDDAQMMALDETLSSIFRETVGKKKSMSRKKESQKARENVVQFKLRVIDLLDIYFKVASPGVDITLKVLKAVIELIGATNDRVVADKARGLVRTRICKIRPIPVLEDEEVVEEVVNETLRPILTMAVRPSNPGQCAAAAQASVFVSRIIIGEKADQKRSSAIGACYGEALSKFIEKPVNGASAAFLELVNFISNFKAK
ncbi:hypothetical protein CANCADRAFT_134429 [Tortispora caseinolytica NRRL Y-17796]|uniref:DNA polymerase V n=1 Tax=Tortispora caseinolytica NRRL Y-17796 TaxID=767744 RepID=A0A1E4TBM8_9ASCO|nr:hypothetical protein CANCADRAFT_134429 [Tortispora caseinolytica NRRL Y-17796]